MRYLAVLIFSLVFLSGCLEGSENNSTGTFSPEEARSSAYDVTLIAGDETTGTGDNATAQGDTNLAPEPATLAMFGLGLGGIVAAARRKKKK